MAQIEHELLEIIKDIRQVSHEVSEVDVVIQSLNDEIGTDLTDRSSALAQQSNRRDTLQAQLQKLRREEASLKKRQKLALRVSGRGHDPKFVLEISEEGLDELERRLNELDLQEMEQKETTLANWIFRLVTKPSHEKMRQLPLLCNDLAKDPVRVMKVKKASLEKECSALTTQLSDIKKRIQIVMGYEHSEDRIANLEASMTELENELRDKREKVDLLTRQIQAQL